MPQLDRIIIFSQIFWLFVIFTSLYAIITHFFLPKFLKSLKARKQIIEINNQEVATIGIKVKEQQNFLKQTVLKNLALVENVLKNEFDLLNADKSNLNNQLIDEKIATISLQNTLYCDAQLLNSILLFPTRLNLKFKSN